MAADQEKRTRGRGRGSSFFALAPDVLTQLWSIQTTNRLNLVIAYLVLLAGTGSNHRLTKWSAKACEEHVGLGKPRAKHAIEELIAGNLVKRTAASTPLMPQYELPELAGDVEPIFMPVQIITGFGGETPVLRRVRETGDPLLLRMLIDLYGLVSLDATHGIPLVNLRGGDNQGEEPTARKVAEIGTHAVWAFTAGIYRSAGGPWAGRHRVEAQNKTLEWAVFWERLDALKKIGAIYEEAWVFESNALDAEPIMPLDLSGFYRVAEPTDAARLSRRALETCRTLVGDERSYIFDQGAEFYLPLPLHHQTPMLRHVTRLTVEADTPGRRLAYKRRMTLIERKSAGFDQLEQDAKAGEYGRPVRLKADAGAA